MKWAIEQDELLTDQLNTTNSCKQTLFGCFRPLVFKDSIYKCLHAWFSINMGALRNFIPGKETSEPLVLWRSSFYYAQSNLFA